MAAKTGKKKIKSRDLKPKKDAKGGLLPAVTPGSNPPNGSNRPGPDVLISGY